jgi:paraquat-inducible protein A
MTILPSLDGGVIDGWVRVFRPAEFEPTTYSILAGVIRLWQEDHRALAALISGFSVVFPVMKLAVMGHAQQVLLSGDASRRPGRVGSLLLKVAHHGGKFSMLDVMVVAVLIVAIKGLPGRSTLEPGWGLYGFAASVVLAMIAAVWLAHLEHQQNHVIP